MRGEHYKQNRQNENFTKKEFQELWNRINHKYAYTVNFESKELIEKAIAAINKELVVSRLSYVVTRGVQKTELKHDDMKAGSMMVQEEMQHDDLRTDVISTVKYDLLGKIAANTRLTRKTIAGILSQIIPSKFDMYKVNPEEFIRRVSRLILEQKATIIVDHISYNKIEGSYDSAIFTEEKHTSLDKAYQGRKSIVDYVFTDGTAKQSVERKFVEDLDTSTDVAVYAKRFPYSYPSGQLFSRLGDSLQGWCREACLFRSRNQGQHVNPRLARHRRWQDSLCRQALRTTLRFGHLLS